MNSARHTQKKRNNTKRNNQKQNLKIVMQFCHFIFSSIIYLLQFGLAQCDCSANEIERHRKRVNGTNCVSVTIKKYLLIIFFILFFFLSFSTLQTLFAQLFLLFFQHFFDSTGYAQAISYYLRYFCC